MFNPKYKFKEGQLPGNFCSGNVEKIKRLLDSNTTFTTVAITSVGVSFLLRFVEMTYPAYFVFVDMYSLPKITKENFYKALCNELGGNFEFDEIRKIFDVCKQRLEAILQKQDKVVIVFNRFDQLEGEFDQNLFANLRSLRNTDPHRVTMVFTSIKPLYEIAANALVGTNLNLLSKYVYLKPYSRDDFALLIRAGLLIKVDKSEQEKLLVLSGGHSQLYQILARSEKRENFILDHFVKLQLKEIYESLNYKRKKEVQKIAIGKTVEAVDDYLQDVGMVVKKGGSYTLFTPLLADYIKSSYSLKLPFKEAKLFRLLRHNLGGLVSKEMIFNTVWDGSPDHATDWALDALIYRLRKNAGFISEGYHIESHKKIGYILFKD